MLEIAISAVAVFAPRAPDWDIPSQAELEFAFEYSGERLSLTLLRLSRSDEPTP